MQDLKQLATILADRKKISVEDATTKINELISGKSKYAANLAIQNYLEEGKVSNTTLPGIEDIDPTEHHKE